MIEQILAQKGAAPQLYNLNMPTPASARGPRQVRVVPMGLEQSWSSTRSGPIRGGGATFGHFPSLAAAGGHETDVSALAQGAITLTPLDFDLTKRSQLAEMEPWQFDLPDNLKSPDDPLCRTGVVEPSRNEERAMRHLSFRSWG